MLPRPELELSSVPQAGLHHGGARAQLFQFSQTLGRCNGGRALCAPDELQRCACYANFVWHLTECPPPSPRK